MRRYSVINATVEQVKKAGGINIRETPRVGVIFADLDDKGVSYLRSVGAIVREVETVRGAQVTPPTPVPVVGATTVSGIIDALGFTEEWRQTIVPPPYGEGMAMAILDTGIREAHELIKGRVVYSRNFTTSPMRDDYDHGTGVCSVAVALAPKCDILNIKVLDDKGMGSDETVIAGIDHVIELGETSPTILPYVINLSLGKPDNGDANDPIRVACRRAIERGMFVVASAGNDGPDPYTITCPACENDVIAVGSISYSPEEPQVLRVSDFSSRGPTQEGLVKPDIALPGEGLVVASSQSDTATVAKSGTSYSSVFGAAIRLLQGESGLKGAIRTGPPELAGVTCPALTIRELMDFWLPRSCTLPSGMTPMVKYNDYGWGVLLAELGPLAIRAIKQEIPMMMTMSFVTPIIVLVLLGAMVRAIWIPGSMK
jgi:serine protease AprX